MRSPNPLIRRVASAALALVVLPWLAPSCRTVPEAATGGNETLPWVPFRWVSAAVGGHTIQRAALLVPFSADTLGASTLWLQLDTGADVGIWLYTAPLDQLLRQRGAVRDTTHWFELPRAVVAGSPVHAEAVNIRRYAGDTIREDDPAPKVGTLGLNFFQHRVLVIDFPNQRLAVLDSAGLSTSVADRAQWVRTIHRNDKLFVPVELEGRVHDGFFWDSGASLFPLSTTPDLWRALTGRREEDPANQQFVVRSFGQDAVFVGAPLVGTLRVGPARLQRPIIYTLSSGPEALDPRHWPFPAEGLIGNALFADAVVVLDMPRHRLGILSLPSATPDTASIRHGANP